MKTSEMLIKAKEKILLPQNWTQHNLAKNKNGDNVKSTSENAVCFCAVGAIESVVLGPDANQWNYRERCLNAMRIVMPKEYYSVSNFNDLHSHQEVLDVFDRAITDQIKKENFSFYIQQLMDNNETQKQKHQ